jgi:hypothetical protein
VERHDGVGGVAEGDVLAAENLVAQVVAPFIGGVQTKLEGVIGSDVIDECPSVTAESCSVADDALGVIAYDE